jgi:hypothetical protein
MGTELDTAPKTELDVSADELQSLIDADRAQEADDALSVPLLKVGQGLSKAVQNGKVANGQFYNTLNFETYEQPVPFVVASYERGRFWSPEGENRGFRAPHQGVIPWADHPDYGKTFAESGDTEENWTTEWKQQRPPISTTYEFTGLIVGASEIPVRLSLMSTSAKTGKTLRQLLRLDRQPWDHTYNLTASRREGRKGDYYVVEVEQADKPDEAVQLQAAKLYLAVKRQGAEAVDGDEAPATPAPAARGDAIDI